MNWTEYNKKNPFLAWRVTPEIKKQLEQIKDQIGAKNNVELVKTLIQSHEESKMNEHQRKARQQLIAKAESGCVVSQEACRKRGWDFAESAVSKSLTEDYKRLAQEIEVVKGRYPHLPLSEIMKLLERK